MKVSLLTQVPIRTLPDDFEQRFESVVKTPWDLVDPDELRATYRDSLEAMMTEPVAAAVAYATEAEGLDVAIYPVGRSLGKAKEPLRVAEELAMLDVISGGRLVAGFPVGLAYDANINNGPPPI